MANLITINENKYFKSKDIKVFPSSFRGAYKSGTATTAPEISFDPEARLNTEANFILPKINFGKSSYIVDYNQTQDKISFVLGGYSFEILQVSSYLEEIKNKYVGITFREVTLQDPADLDFQFQHDSKRITKLLNSWENSSTHILDTLDTTSDQYYFTGLKVLESDFSSEGSYAIIKLFTSDGQLNREECLPTLKHGSGENTLLHGVGLEAAHANQTIVGKYNKNDSASLFEIGSGTGVEPSERKNAFEVSTTKTTINTATDIKGTVTVTGNIQATGKIKSQRTTASDDDDVLITKSYVDNKISGIGSGAPVGGAGKYVKSVTQNGATVSTDLEKFDSSVEDDKGVANSNNAPTSLAVQSFVDTEISKLDAGPFGGSNTFIQKVEEIDGKIIATPKSFSTDIKADPTNNTTVPTTKAVVDYIKGLLGEGIDLSQTTISAAISTVQNNVTNLETTSSAGGEGSYIRAIDQKDGIVTPTSQKFDSAVEIETNGVMVANPLNAPTSLAVQNFVNTTISKLWTEELVKKNPNNPGDPTFSLKSILLDAIYPIGSIYIQYVQKKDAVPDHCPITNTLGGKWTLIPEGKFLCAASDTGTVAYKHGNGIDATDDAGYANATIVQHTHTHEASVSFDEDSVFHENKIKKVKTSSNGSHTHTVNIPGADWGTGAITGFDGRRSDGTESKEWTTASSGGHTHSFPHPTISLTINEAGQSATNKNLPPYLAVFMWRRTS